MTSIDKAQLKALYNCDNQKRSAAVPTQTTTTTSTTTTTPATTTTGRTKSIAPVYSTIRKSSAVTGTIETFPSFRKPHSHGNSKERVGSLR